MATEIAQRLITGPTILFLGQDYLQLGRETNPFLDLLRDRYPNVESNPTTISSYLPEITKEDKIPILTWMHRRSQKIPINEQLSIISDFAWNHIYTSSVDEVWVRAFAKTWRSLLSIFTDKNFPQDIRDRHRLCSTFLFGCVDKENNESRIPYDEDELDDRRQVAIALLRRIPDILSPRGTLIIEGWNPKTDWIGSKDLRPVLSQLGNSQVIMFSATQEIQSDPRLVRLCEAGILVFVNQSLAEVLSVAVNSGVISLGDPGALLPNGRQITIDSHLAYIPKDTYLQVEPFGTVLDDNLILPPKRVSRDTEYFEFLSFLEEPVKLRNWDPYANGFPFQRDYYFTLSEQVEKQLKSANANSGPIILHGETGTGKTVSLATLAYNIASNGGFPVIFIERTSRNMGIEETLSLERLLNWAEDAGAEACLVVWDGMLQLEAYTQLWTRLADRGRKAVIVGSTYLQSENQKKSKLINAPRLFNPHENTRFLEYLQKHAPEIANWVKEKNTRIDQAFIVALYRLLPPARPSIRVGVVKEFQDDQRSVFERIKNLSDVPTGINTLEAAFRAISDLSLPVGPELVIGASPWEKSSNIHGETMTTIQRLFALVMTVGRYGCRIPIELVLATLGQPVTNKLVEALKTKVIVWHESTNGDLFLEPRQPLEAQIYIDSLFGGKPQPEADLICSLIASLPRPSDDVGAEASISFILELLQLIGPNSDISAYSSRFKPCILQFAEALTQVRKTRSVVSTRLMLQEATFYREGVRTGE